MGSQQMQNNPFNKILNQQKLNPEGTFTFDWIDFKEELWRLWENWKFGVQTCMYHGHATIPSMVLVFS